MLLPHASPLLLLSPLLLHSFCHTPRPFRQQGDGRGGIAALLSAKKFGRVLDLAGGRPLGAFEPNSLGNQLRRGIEGADGR